MLSRLIHIITFFIFIAGLRTGYAACGANTRTWQAGSGTTTWTTNGNWNAANHPNGQNENALIVSAWFNPTYSGTNLTIGCLEVQSGLLTASAAGTLSMQRDYFRNLNPGGIVVPGGSTWEVNFVGTIAQTYSNVDNIPRLRINNAVSVDITESSTITDRFLLDAGSGLINIHKNLVLSQTTDFNIPASATFTIKTGGSLQLAGNINVDGILVMEPGSSLIMSNGRTLTINASGILDINGATGNSVTITSTNSSSLYAFVVNGRIDARYLTVSRMTTNGLQMNGTVTGFDSVNINTIPSNGSGLRFGAAASLPATMDQIGFFVGIGGGPFVNVHASNYNLTTVNFTNHSGIGGAANEADGNSKVTWGASASPVLQVQNVSASGVPPTTIGKGSASTHFGTFAFSMSGTAAVATNVTQLVLTLDGTNYSSDVTNAAVYNDTNSNCVYDAGTDTLIGNYTPSGNPATVTVNMTNEINVIDTAQDCLHVFLTTSSSATTGHTVGFRVSSSDDITNSQGYGLSGTTGPPVSAGVATIAGAAIKRWNGGSSTTMATASNWTPNGAPTSATDCEIGSAFRIPVMAGTVNCLNTTFASPGTLNWNTTSNAFTIYGDWIVQNGFVYQNATAAVVNLMGSTSKTIAMNGTTFPRNVNVSTSSVAIFQGTGTISGALAINSGIFRIANGATLNVTGSITVASGATFDIEPGGTLTIGNGSTFIVSSGGTLEMVGTSSLPASIRAINDSSRYTITINNGATISARYYSLRNLGLTGLTISATANINGTNFLQNGSFTYPGINNANLLRLQREIPGNTLTGMAFDSDGSTVTGVVSVFTNTGATANSLTISSYSGNRTGASYTNATNYLVNWNSPTNELRLTQVTTAPASANQGNVVDMGSFGFRQLNAGAFSNTNITSMRITLTGSATATDVDSATLYYDPTCAAATGTLIGTVPFTGTPARAQFNGISGAVVEAHATTPPTRCFNVYYNLNALATDGRTVGAEISTGAHVTNSQNYAFNASFAPPVNLGVATIAGAVTVWDGSTDTLWTRAANWSNGVPSSTKSCIINNQANDPVITTGTANCRSMTIGTGILTLTGGQLHIYGSIESTGTITGNFPIVIRDNGTTATTQNIEVSSPIYQFTFNKTAGGTVTVDSNLTLSTNINMGASQNFILNITQGHTLTANAGVTVTGGTIEMAGGSELRIGSGQSILVNGGTFRTRGTEDAYPQSLGNKAHITNATGTNTYAFTATSGTVDLSGFYIDWLNASGLNLAGSVNIASLDGGQLRNLPSSAGMRALQISTTGAVPSTVSNFGWNFGPNNAPPAEATNYFLAYSGGCANRTIDFDQWFGDFWPFTTAIITSKVSNTSCNIMVTKAKTPVALTEFKATGYDQKVVVEWTTGNEWNHRGFNVYRSSSPADSFVQVNKELIRNDLFSTSIHGTYAFIDDGVSNGQTYYYMLEDLSLMGESKMHGPVSVSPDASFGNPPLIPAGTIASNGDEGDAPTGSSFDEGAIEITSNVWVVAQTPQYARMKITVPDLATQPDPLNVSYKKLSIEGYSMSTTIGRPELPTKTILLKVESLFQNTRLEIDTITSSDFGTIPVTPAPDYISVGNQMVPQWTLDSAFYGLNQVSPSETIQLKSVVTVGDQHYLPIQVHPVAYNAATGELIKADTIIFDLYLSGVPPWASAHGVQDPWTREGGIKIGMREEGMYEISYAALKAAGMIAPLDGVNVEDIHVRVAQTQVGVDVQSTTGHFSDGDSLRFFAPSLKSDEDLNTYALLYVDSGEDSYHSQIVDAAPSNHPFSSSPGFWTKKKFEENNIAVFNEPFTEETDHFFWSLIYGISGGATAPLEIQADLPGLHPGGDVTVRATVKSRTANSVNTHHNLELYINTAASAVAEASFTAVEANIISFRVPGRFFVAGINSIKLVATGNNLPVGDYDMLYVDNIEVYYTRGWGVDNQAAMVLDQAQNESYKLNGFDSPDIHVYDVSIPSELYRFDNTQTSSDDGSFAVQFSTSSSSPSRRLWVGQSSQFKSPHSYRLLRGSHLRDSNNMADILYIGQYDMLKTIQPLGAFRRDQGYTPLYVELDSIYNEFSFGKADVKAIKDFLSFTKTWKKVPMYVVLLGDGTYDPKAYQNDFQKYRFPVKFMVGSSFDYVSDHWFVANEQGIPEKIIARIPAPNPDVLAQYRDKVIAYESGERKPAGHDRISFFSDKATYYGEDFDKPIVDIQTSATRKNILNPMVHKSRTSLNDSQMKQSILDSFSESSIIHYMGHGAENMWASNRVFTTADSGTLAQKNFPVVVAMNCLNAQFADPDFYSLSEELTLNRSGGAILFWGSTNLTPPGIQKIYQDVFYENLAAGDYKNFGDLIMKTKTQAGLSSPFEEALYSWSIIGDPLIHPSISHKAQPTQTSSSPVPEVGAEGGGGCSAFAGYGAHRGYAPWDRVLDFFLEVFIALAFIRIVARTSAGKKS